MLVSSSSYTFFVCMDNSNGLLTRLGAAILSHHVDEFTLVSAFFLFSIGCLNILVGLIWREKVKTRRSLTAWKDRADDVLPTRAVSKLDKFSRSGTVTSSTERSGYGFGRQGEKAAALKGTCACVCVVSTDNFWGCLGFLISTPSETLPRYASKPSRASSPVFSSSATAI
jgi:hypothetical protein